MGITVAIAGENTLLLPLLVVPFGAMQAGDDAMGIEAIDEDTAMVVEAEDEDGTTT